MFKIGDYIVTKDGMWDGLIAFDYEDGYYDVEFDCGNGWGNFIFLEDEIEKSEDIPEYYIEYQKQLKGE